MAVAKTLLPDGSLADVTYPDINDEDELVIEVNIGDRVLCYDAFDKTNPYVGIVVNGGDRNQVCQIRRDDGQPGGGDIDTEGDGQPLWIISGDTERIVRVLREDAFLDPTTRGTNVSDANRINRLMASVDAIRNELEVVRQNLRSDQLSDPYADRYYGFVRRYRFTMGGQGEMPSHRFEVECDSGVWLFCEMSVERFARLMRPMSNGKIKPSSVNGLFVEVASVTGERLMARRVIPEDMLLNGKYDRFGRQLFVGASVRYEGEVATIARDRPGTGSVYLNGEQIDGDLAASAESVIRL